jgi:hypothetical protein
MMAQIFTTVSAAVTIQRRWRGARGRSQRTTLCVVNAVDASSDSNTARRHRCHSPPPPTPDVKVDASALSAEDAAAVVLQRQVRATRARQQCRRKQTAAVTEETAAVHGVVAERLLPETAVTEERATTVRIQAQDDRGMPGAVVAVVVGGGVEADWNEAHVSLIAALGVGDVAPKCVAEDSPGVVVDCSSNGEDREGEEDYDPEEDHVPLAIPEEVAPGISKEALLRLLGENGEDDIAEDLYTPFLPETVEDGDHDDGSGDGSGGGADGYSSDEDEVEDDAVLSKFVRIHLDG